MSSLFRRKHYAENTDSGQLNRVLGTWDIVFFGIAAIIGAGSFSSLGEAIFRGGPGVIILYLICGFACAFTALCYAEFASRIPTAGSAYTYAYASFGELIAWVIGWALIMEYSFGNIYVAFPGPIILPVLWEESVFISLIILLAVIPKLKKRFSIILPMQN